MLGAGLGLLFAPKSGSDLRHQISEQAGTIGQTAADGYRRASETAGELADKSRNVYGRVREVVSRGADEVKRETPEWPS
jgi:gas vesicle protein